MKTLGSLTEHLSALLDAEVPTCLWFSGGRDSRLLLEALLLDGRHFGLLRFDDGWTREQRDSVSAVIMKHELQAFSYPALEHLLTRDEKDISLVSAYVVDGNGSTALLVRDLVDDPKRCAFDVKLERSTLRRAPIAWKQHIWGTRFEDRHWLGQDKPLAAASWSIGSAEFFAPLWDWTAEDVDSALAGLGIETEAFAGDIASCHACLSADDKVFCPKEGREIKPAVWDPAANTDTVRSMLQTV